MARRLPTFQEIRVNALRLLGDTQDVLRSDWPEGHGPTARQAKAAAKAREHIAKAKAALDQAAR